MKPAYSGKWTALNAIDTSIQMMLRLPHVNAMMRRSVLLGVWSPITLNPMTLIQRMNMGSR